MANSTPFLIGQRVIYQGVIVTVCKPEREGSLDTWVYNPEKEYKHYVAESNLKPLPNGQL